MRTRMILLSILAFVIVNVALIANGQVATGIYAGGTFDSKGFDTINIGNLNAHFEIPIFSKAGRGLAFQHSLVYDSAIWRKVGTAGSEYWTPVDGWGWRGGTQNLGGDLQFFEAGFKCWDDADHTSPFYIGPVNGNFTWTDQSGHSHTFGFASITSCDYPIYGVQNGVFPADDSSGISLVADTFYGYHILMPDGRIYYPTYNGAPGAAGIADTNGNQITESSSGAAITYTDTTGSTVLTINGAGDHTSPRVLTYPTYVSGSAGTASVHVYYASHNIQTAFGCAGVTEYAPSFSVDLVDHIQLADGQTYSFTYEPTPGISSKTTGRLAWVTLPGGGRINYQYSGSSNGIICQDGGTATLTRSMPDDPAGASSWVYARTPSGSAPSPTHTDVTDGMSVANHAAYDFVSDPADYENYMFATRHLQYDGPASGTPLLSELTCYNGAVASCVTQSLSLPISATEIISTIDGASVKKTTRTFDAYGSLTSQTDYDFGATSPGGQVRSMTISYATLGNGIVNRPATVSIYGSQSSPMQTTTYAYDGATPAPTSGLPQHVAVSGSRGNLTSVSVYTNSTSSLQIQSNTYNDAGQIVTTKDVLNHSTTYSYDTSTGTFVTSTVLPSTGSVVHGTSASFDTPTGLLLSSTDDNGAGRTYAYDNMLRPVSLGLPASGAVSYTYTLASSSPSVTVSTKHSTGSAIDSVSKLDGYARLTRLERSDVGASAGINYTYDGDGRLHTVSNPDSADVTAADYDGLGRTRLIVDSDGTSKSRITYSGNLIFATDEALKQRKIFRDALGRISMVLEPDSGGVFNLETSYEYDQNQTSSSAFPNTYQTIITQKGGSLVSSNWRIREFTYDTLGRMLTSTTPEAGTISYTFPTVGAFCSGDLTLPCSRTDANSTVTTYAYDALNRLTAKTYSGSSSPGTTIAANTPAVSYFYDQAAYNGLTIANGKGLRTGMSDGSGYTAWSYDAAGNISDVRKTINGITKQAAVTYNNDSSINTLTDFAGTSFGFSYDAAGRVTTLSDAVRSYVSAAAYNRAGELTYFAQQPVGQNPGDGYETNWTYNSRLQPVSGWVQWSAGGFGSMYYDYGASGANNGNIMSMDTPSGHQSFTYDQLNRLSTAKEDYTWGQTYTYDNWGNLYDVSRIGSLGGHNWTASADVHNRLSTQSYDAVGQMVTDEASRSFTYDAEGRILTGGSGSYVYDGDGRRVMKTVSGTATLYWPSMGGISDESNATGTSFHKQVALNGRKVYGETPSGTGLFMFTDHLGSVRVTSAIDDSPTDLYDYLPFGAVFANGGYAPTDNHFTFTGYESDQSENGTDYAVFRNLTTQTGRLNRPDPYPGSYDLTNPQSLNRYVYALNRPFYYVDRNGLDFCEYFEGDSTTIVEEVDYDPDYNDCISSGGRYYDTCGSSGICKSGGGGGVGTSNGGFGGITASGPSGPGSPGGSGGGGTSSAPSNPARKTCIAQAITGGLETTALDSIGLAAPAGLARWFGHQAGYRGIVADNLGKKVLGAISGTSTGLSLATSVQSAFSTPEDALYTVASVMSFIPVPGMSQATSIVMMGVDVYKTVQQVRKC